MKKILLVTILTGIFIGILFHLECKKSNSILELVTGIKWVLESIQYSRNGVQIEENFSITFNEDGTVNMEVDCNVCTGTYELGSDRSITFGTRVCTEAHCGLDSKDLEFHAALDSASTYDITENELRIYFNSRQSYLNFVPE